MSTFNPDDAAAPGSGIFGLPFTRAQASIVLVPVPFDATTSYRPGTADGPSAILQASAQVDLLDRRFGPVYERGIFMEEEDRQVRKLSAQAGALARPLIEAGGGEADPESLARVNAASEALNDFVHDRVARILAEGKTPGVVGGEHAVPFGAIRAVAEKFGPIGVLHVDAHMDLRQAYEGFSFSHASIMHNVLTHLQRVTRLVQVGLRDCCRAEVDFAKAQGDRVHAHYDDVWAQRLLDGERFSDLAAHAIGALPDTVYVSFDVDGLDPSLCPHTGTPVPGGLSFNQAALLLDALRASGKRVVGFDLVEVAPGPVGEPEWDANVGARVLYKLCALAGPG
ncbi:MAG: agmatinase [Phycisphaerae bacterium]|nr:agmatinase [Phycisphaerae bacterium]